MDHVGIDLHKRESPICILVEGGELIEHRIRTEPQRFAEALGGRASAQVLLESSNGSAGVWRRSATTLPSPTPNFAPMYATRTRKVTLARRHAAAAAAAPVAASP